MSMDKLIQDITEEQQAGQIRYDLFRTHLATLTTEELHDTTADALHFLSELLHNPSDFNRANAERFLAEIESKKHNGK